MQAQYLSAKGLEQLLQTVQKVRRQINPKLKIDGILLTMTDSRTNYGKQISNLIRQAYGKHLKVFEQTIPRSVRAAETSAAGKSIFAYDPRARWQKPTNLLQRRCRRMPIDSGNLALKGLDDLFSTEENRQEEQREQVQQIPMQRMFEDGTCRVRPGYYTRTIQYQDINYQLAQQEDKTAIFEEWCSFLNFFDSSIKFELSFVNMATDSTEFEKSIRIPFQKDGFDDVRAEYSQMLRQQLAKGNNGLTKTKFITFGVEGESMAQVKPRLDHIQNDLLNNFHRLGVQAKPLNGAQRLKLMHDMFNMDGASKFHFDWKDL